jgi:hypothetical protein
MPPVAGAPSAKRVHTTSHTATFVLNKVTTRRKRKPMATKKKKTKHARFGPSSLDALSRCVRFKYGEMDDDAAAEGTALHKAAETGDTSGLPDDQIEDVEQARAAIESLKCGEGEWEDYAEVRVELKDLTYGTADRVLVNYTQGIIYAADFKFTRVAGDHEFQARTYGAGVYEGMTDEQRAMIKKVITYIVAPRLNLIELGEYEPVELLAKVRQEIEDLYERIDSPWNPPTPHGDLCSKCARIAGCPAAGKTMVKVTKALGLPLPDTFDMGSLVTTTDRAMAQAAAAMAENWGKEVKKKNTEFVKASGQDIPGYALRSRSTGARIPKENTVAAVAVLRTQGYTDDEILQSCKMSINDLAKAHAEVTTLKVMEVKEGLKGVLDGLTVEGQATYLQKTKRVTEEQLLKQLIQGI